MATMGGGMGAMGGGWAGENMGESRGYGSVGGSVDYGARNTYEQSTNYGVSMGGAGGRRGGSVLMIYGLEPAKFNCQRLFNLFCQYGNIVRIMFLKNKEGTAMVELDSPESVNKAIQNLNHVPIFGLKLKLEWSKKEFIEEVKHPHQLCDGSTSYTDFARDRNNRFDTPERAAKNRIIAPTKILHYYNVPKMEDQDMEDIYTSAGATAPTKIKWFPPKSEKSASGLCEFDSAQEACEALVLANHTEIEGTKKYPFCMKLCFSPATH